MDCFKNGKFPFSSLIKSGLPAIYLRVPIITISLSQLERLELHLTSTESAAIIGRCKEIEEMYDHR